MEKKIFIEEVVKEINECGIFAQYTEVDKNGVKRHGVTVGEGTVKPNIYLDSFYDDDFSVSDTADKVIEIAKKNKVDNAEKFTSFLDDREYCLNNVFVVCSKANTYPNCINRQDNGITLTMVIVISKDIEGRATVRVTPALLDKLNISEEELWKIAKANTEKDVVVKGMFETLSEMMRGEVPFSIEPQDDKMLVVSNNSKCNGAYAVFTETAKAEIKKRMNVDEVIIIPSSIHECIVVPHTDEMSMEDVANMVKEVNATQVADEDILSDTPIAMAI